jgi:hypothetical protein
MKEGVIKAANRHVVRRMRNAMQGDVIRALVELITNGDDSYSRLADAGRSVEHRIDVKYGKDGYNGVFAVRDFAEGMSYAQVDENFTTYGAPTSGLSAGKSVRGYFGEGAKDCLATMRDGHIGTFKDGQFVECRLFIDTATQEPRYQIEDAVPATSALRKKHRIPGDGSVAYFVFERTADTRVPRYVTVFSELSNNYQLRKIMMDPNKHVWLADSDGVSQELQFRPPPGLKRKPRDFEIEYGDVLAKVRADIWRAEHSLQQSGDDREGGLLLLDDCDAVLGITLFRFDTEPLAAHLFGEVKITGFRRLLEQEEAVLSERRDGLDANHPFCKALIFELEAILEEEVARERGQRKSEQGKIDKKERERYRKAFGILNDIAEKETQSVTNLGGDHTDELEAPPNGMALYPLSAQVQAGKRYNFELRVDTTVVDRAIPIAVSTTCPGASLVTTEVRLTPDDGEGVVRKYVTLDATEPHAAGDLIAVASHRVAKAHLDVTPEQVLLLEEGMVFEPQTVIVQPNHQRRVSLHVYVKVVPDGSTIKLTSDNPAIHVSRDQLVVVEAEAQRNIVTFELEVWGDGAGQDALIQAEYEDWSTALLQVTVRSKKPVEPAGRKGMFSEPKYNPDPDPLQRANYSRETGEVIIYLNFPTVREYLGANREFAKTLPAQVLVADILTERCLREVARDKAEKRGAITEAALRDRVDRDTNDLIKMYGSRIHKALVDQDLLRAAQAEVQPD